MQNNSINSSFDKSQTNEAFDIKQFIYKIYTKWPWILLSIIAGVAIAFAYNRYTDPRYKAKSVIMIKDEKKGGDMLDNPLLKELDLSSGGKLVENETEILKSYDLMETVVRKLQLFVSIQTKGNFASRTVYGTEVPFILRVANPDTIQAPFQWTLQRQGPKWSLIYSDKAHALPLTPGKWYIIDGFMFQTSPNTAFKSPSGDSTGGASEYLVNFNTVKTAVTGYSNAFNCKPTSKTASIVGLELSDLNAARAQAALSTLVGIYNQQGLEDKNKVTTNTLDFLNGRLAIIEKELRQVEGQVESFKSTNRVTDVNAEAQQYLDQIKQIDVQKAQQQTQLTILESLEQNLRENQSDPKLVPSGVGIAEPTLAEMIQTHNKLVLERERQAERLGPKNPIPVDLGNQIVNLRESLLGNISSLKRAFRINLNDITSKDAELSLRIKNIPQIEKNLVQIKRDQSVKEQLYFLLLQKREESAITLASVTQDSRSIEKPRSIGQVSPNKPFVLAIGFLLGLALPIVFIYLKGFLDNKIEDKEEVQQKCSAPVLGEISYVKKETSPVVVQDGARTIIAEQFRVIRTNISFAKPGESHKTILVTSHRPEEGKSFTSLNLAASYALLNKKVVVLEFDLRKPRLSMALNISHDKGISNYLSSNNLKTDELLVKVPNFKDNFWLLPAGPIPPNPAELILGPRMQKLIEELNSKFDFVILDTPPYSLVTDSSLLSTFADMSIVVLRQNFTFKWVLQELNRKIAENPKHPIYTVINRVGEKGRYHNYRQYGYTEYFDTPVKKRRFLKF